MDTDKLTPERIAYVIRKLDKLRRGDPEKTHGDAEDLLLSLLPPEVEEAFRRAADRVGFWYA